MISMPIIDASNINTGQISRKKNLKRIISHFLFDRKCFGGLLCEKFPIKTKY